MTPSRFRGAAYYAASLSALRLRRCYEVATPAIRRYLEAELDFVLSRCGAGDRVLELGCGYGRALEVISPFVDTLVGIDTSWSSLVLAQSLLDDRTNCRFAVMDAVCLAIPNGTFDRVVCIQNGISSFGVARQTLMTEALRVTRSGGQVLFSSYAESFWPERLEWFELQAEHQLLGEIDREATGNGVIVCKDGFRSDTVRSDEFESLATSCGVSFEVFEIGGSSVFCVLTPNA